MHDPEEQQWAAFDTWIQAAPAIRFSADPAARLAAIEPLRDDVPGVTPGGSVTITAALARLQLCKMEQQSAPDAASPDGASSEDSADSTHMVMPAPTLAPVQNE
jgi:hypothetical protein